MTQQMPPSSPEQPLPPAYGGYPPAPAPAPRTNTMAVLSIVFAFVFAPLGIVFGLVGRGQIKRTGEGGRGLATAGLVLSIVFLVLGILGVVAGIVVAVNAPSGVSNEQVASQIVSQSGGRVSGVTCPGSPPAAVGAQVTCTATVDGAPGRIQATVTSVDNGTVSFDFTQVG